MKTFFSLCCCALLFSLTVLSFSSCSQDSKQSQTITIWHWMTDRHQAFNALALKYKDLTGIQVKFELYAPSDSYSQKIVAAAQAKVLPDIFGILDKKEIVAAFIESGFVADLTNDFKADESAWEKTFFPKALAVNKFEKGNIYSIPPGIYGVPLDVTNIQMLYNKNLLKKAGIMQPPQTLKDFFVAVEALKRVGIPALVSGWGEMWMLDCFASNYAFNIMGEEKVLATFRGEVPYTDPDWIKVFTLFKDLKEKGALVEGIVTKANKYAEQDFALERAAFAFNGSWCVNVYHDMNKDLQYGVMMPPSIPSMYPMRIWGGAGTSLVVNNTSSRKAAAINFLKWLSAKDQQAYLSTETKNLPANLEALDSIPEVLSQFAMGMEKTTHPTIWKYNEDSLVTETLDKGLQSLIIGEKTPEQVGKEVQAVKERQLAKAKARQK